MARKIFGGEARGGQVHHRQRLGGDNVEIGQIGRIESGGGQQIGEQLLMHPLPAPRPVLVEFNCHERCLGLTAETRDHEGVRVALFEVVQRTVHEIFEHLRPGSVVAQPV